MMRVYYMVTREDGDQLIHCVHCDVLDINHFTNKVSNEFGPVCTVQQLFMVKYIPITNTETT